MLVADTSVWIDYFNGKRCPETDLLDDKVDARHSFVGTGARPCAPTIPKTV